MIKDGTRRYLGLEHKEYSERCQQEVEQMQLHPLTHEEFLEQIEKNRTASELRGTIGNNANHHKVRKLF